MRLHYKIMGLLLLAFLIPAVVLGTGGYLSIKRTGDRAAERSVEALLNAEHERLRNDTRARALDLEQLCSRFEDAVSHVSARVARTHRKLPLYRLEAISSTYEHRDTAGLPGYGYVHPVHGAYADYEGKGPGGPWVPRHVVDQVRKDAAKREEVARSLHTVMLVNNELIDANRQFPSTLDLAWVVLWNGVTNAHPPYDYKKIIARNPDIVDLDETQQDYVLVAAPKANPERRVRWLAPYLDHFKGVWMTSCVAPVYHEDEFLGAVGSDILMSVITGRVLQEESPRHGYAFLVGPTGKVVAIPEQGVDDILWLPEHRKAMRETYRAPRDQVWSDEMVRTIELTSLSDSPNLALRGVVEQMLQGRTGLRTFELGHSTKLVSYAPVRTSGWSLAVVVPYDDVVVPARQVEAVLDEGVTRTLRNYVGLGLFGALASLLVGLLLHRRVIRPLARFTRSVADVRWDNLDVDFPSEPGRDELGRLYAKFAAMLQLIRRARDEISDKSKALEETNEKLLAANEDLEWENEVRRRAEEALAEEKELIAVTLQSIGDGVIAADTDGVVMLLNPVAGSMTGWPPEEAIGQPLGEVMRVLDERTRRPMPDVLSRLREDSEAPGSGQGVLVARDGETRSIAQSAAPIRDEDGELRGVVLVFRDVTKQKRMEDALITAQKLETVRLLAAGIAHDFNNLLTSVVGNLTLARRLAARGEGFGDRLDDMQQALARARDLTQQLLTFASGGAPVRKALHLAPVLQEAARFALRGSNVSFSCEAPDDLWPVVADEGQIAQVVQNLVINAAQALPEGGTISVRAANRVVEPGDGLPVETGRYVEVAVADEGVGIDEEALRRVFEPFFTTKPQGSGLGLAVCFSIMQQHQGHIGIVSAPGRGTTVRVLLPASDLPPGPRSTPPRSRRGSGRVLVMDDDATIRRTSEAMLRELGYDVTCTEDGYEAVEAYERAMGEGRPFDLVVLDLTVPGRPGGLEAMAKLRAIDPRVRAVVASGYSTAPVMDRVQDYGFCASIAKPFGIDELGAVIAEAMGRPVGGPASS